ncbi:chew domain protein [Kaistia sp. 32K]|uniref:chemotaxis protein CheW n=1 Tax=Kaistia sp. 32K TaxID=2795690 RepID=UPI001915B77F|nr:chemotaxis protein CheW [Kaistia sp. 32K]BCP55749.1 chew domain protein [Kaistia sp. 32K]
MSDESRTTTVEAVEADAVAAPRGRDREAYAEIARGLLDRPLPPEYRAEWALHFASEKAIESEVEEERAAAVIFRIGEEWLALSTAVFEEVAEPRRVHTLPHRRNGVVRGIVNVRGELLVCISFATLLGIDKDVAVERRDRSLHFERMVVIGRANGRIAFSVHEVHGIHRYERSALSPVPGTVGQAVSSFTTAVLNWQGRTVGLLDEIRLLDAIDRNIA